MDHFQRKAEMEERWINRKKDNQKQKCRVNIPTSSKSERGSWKIPGEIQTERKRLKDKQSLKKFKEKPRNTVIKRMIQTGEINTKRLSPKMK